MQCFGSLSMGGAMAPVRPDETTVPTDAAGQFAIAAPTGRVRVFCFAPEGSGLSVAGTDVDVSATGAAAVEIVAVRDTAGPARGRAGFGVTRAFLPLTVSIVEPGSPAASAGLAAGDRIVSLDGAALQGVLPMGLVVLIGNHPPGTTATLGIERGGTPQTIKIVMAGGKRGS
jgi:S1-C subfamily serine protease